jgi:hypothetical protein
MKDYTPLIVAGVLSLTHVMTFIAGFTAAKTECIKEAILHDAGQYISDEHGEPKFQWFYREVKP